MNVVQYNRESRRSKQENSLEKQQAMADTVFQHATQRYALVTGANKGIGFEICRQLASKGIMVILASRNERRGVEARERLLKESTSISENDVVFYQLDVLDPASVATLVEFIKAKFGRLDILVSNAGVSGNHVEGDVSVLNEYFEAEAKSLESGGGKTEPSHPKANGRLVETFEGAKECIETNYYGSKRVTEAFIPLLQKSNSPRIVYVSSTLGTVVPNEWAKGVFSSEEGLTEEEVEKVVEEFLKDFKEAKLQENQWPPHFAAYKVSKQALNAYSRIVAKKNPSLGVNAVCPGLTRTDLSCNMGPFSDVEAAEAPVNVALLPHRGPSGCFFTRDEALSLS